MNETPLDKARKTAQIIWYVILIVVTFVFVINYGFTDWEKVSGDFVKATEDILEGIDCTIDYQDFHYEGMCLNQEEIFAFLNNQTDQLTK